MLFEFIAAVAAGIAVAGVAMGCRWISRGLLPKWIVPVAAGLGMLSYTIWSEYTWFERTVASFQRPVEVAWSNADSAFWRPWSYVLPLATRFTAVDTATVQRHDGQPGQVMVDLLFAARWQQTARVKVVFDCNGHRRANLATGGVSVADDGSIVGATWVDIPADDPAMTIACRQP